MKFIKSLAYLEPLFKDSEEYKTLNTGQKKFFSAVFNDKNVALTSAAGCGKSYCLKVLCDFLKRNGIFVGKTAPTGVAALNIGGMTLHCWAGLGLADEDVRSVVNNAIKNKRARDRVQNTSILVIDEVSMVSADLLNKFDAVTKAFRYSQEPFGGIKVIFSFDFFQLAPVSKSLGPTSQFAFESPIWDKAKFKTIELKKLVRQDENTPYAKLLQNIRVGKTTGISLLNSRMYAKLPGELEPIRIFCKNVDIDRYNLEKYNQISGHEEVYTAKDSGHERYTEFFNRNCLAPQVLKLKEGAQVMLLANVDTEAGLVNGSIGKVTGFAPLGPIVKFENGCTEIVCVNEWEAKEQELDCTGNMAYKVVAKRKQVPLRLAYSVTTHKTQGMTLERAVVDLSGAFTYGQHYVALSRVKTLEGLSLIPFDIAGIKAHPRVAEFYRRLSGKTVASSEEK